MHVLTPMLSRCAWRCVQRQNQPWLWFCQARPPGLSLKSCTTVEAQSQDSQIGVPMTRIPKLGIAKMGRFRAALMQTPLRPSLSFGRGLFILHTRDHKNHGNDGTPRWKFEKKKFVFNSRPPNRIASDFKSNLIAVTEHSSSKPRKWSHTDPKTQVDSS